MHNHPGSMMVIITMLMSFLLISATFLWRGVIAMHDSAIARQQYMYKKIALEDLLQYSIALVQKRDVLQTTEYQFDHWPLHTQARWYWQAKVVMSKADASLHIDAHLYDKEQLALCGSCRLTMTIGDAGDIWFIDGWTIE